MIRVCLLGVLTCCGVASASTPVAFVRGEKSVRAGMEWNRRIELRRAGAVWCDIVSGAPISVTLIADRSYRALTRGDPDGVFREDLVFSSDHADGRFGQRFEVGFPGAYWFIIENRSDLRQRVTLACRDAEDSPAE